MKTLENSKDVELRESLKGAYLKIITNYSQFLIILTNINLKWFFQIKAIFVTEAAPLGSPYKILRLNCLFGSNYYYFNFLTFLLLKF